MVRPIPNPTICIGMVMPTNGTTSSSVFVAACWCVYRYAIITSRCPISFDVQCCVWRYNDFFSPSLVVHMLRRRAPMQLHTSLFVHTRQRYSIRPGARRATLATLDFQTMYVCSCLRTAWPRGRCSSVSIDMWCCPITTCRCLPMLGDCCRFL